MDGEGVRRAGLLIGTVTIMADLFGALVAGSWTRGEVVGIADLELNLYTVNTVGGLILAGIGILAVIAVLSRTPVPMWIASGRGRRPWRSTGSSCRTPTLATRSAWTVARSRCCSACACAASPPWRGQGPADLSLA